MQFPVGSNPWMRHDLVLQEEQNRLAVMVAEYDAECQGEQPLRDAHYEQASAPASDARVAGTLASGQQAVSVAST